MTNCDLLGQSRGLYPKTTIYSHGEIICICVYKERYQQFNDIHNY